MKCKNCNNPKLKKVFKIGKQAISSVFFDKPKYNLKKYSLDLFKCPKCDLVQFSSLPPLEDMYGLTYGYNTSLSPLMVKHMREKFKFLKSNFSRLCCIPQHISCSNLCNLDIISLLLSKFKKKRDVPTRTMIFIVLANTSHLTACRFYQTSSVPKRLI